MIKRANSCKTVKSNFTTQQRKNSLSSLHCTKDVNPSKNKKSKQTKSLSRISQKPKQIKSSQEMKENMEMKEKIQQITQGIQKNKEDICRLIREATLSKVQEVKKCAGNCNWKLEEELLKVRKIRLALEAEKEGAHKWLREKQSQYFHILELFKEAKK